jgi:hypothetical protein
MNPADIIVISGANSTAAHIRKVAEQ